MTSPRSQALAASLPQRVSTLDLFMTPSGTRRRRPLAVSVAAAAGIALLMGVVAGALAAESFAERATVEA